jgi:ABC-type lipoprotein export system ATPase subunit
MTTFFNLQLPAPQQALPVTITIETSGSLVILGANGSGKTRLGAWLEMESGQKNNVHRVSAQKSLTMPVVSVSTSIDAAKADLIFGYKEGNFGHKVGNRWGGNPNTFLLNDFEKLLVYLFSDENDISTKYRQSAKQSEERIEPPETKLDVIQRIWEQVLPHRKLLIGGGKIETKMIDDSAVPYNAAEMSDGERVIFYLIGQALAAPKDGIIIIDEPELHLHKSLQSGLWDSIESERPDCLFVYLTHDVDFASSRVNATKICLKSFDGKIWDWYVVSDDTEIPEDVLLEIAGSRKPVIFIEGDKASLDYFLYPKLYANFTIVPVGGCESVIHATVSFASTQLKGLHRVSSFGLIDRDFREADEVTYLKSLGVYVLDFSELENLLLTEGVLSSVAEKLHRTDFPVLFEKCKTLVLSEMERNKDRLISSIAAATIERKLKSFDAKAVGEDNLKDSFENLTQTIDVAAIYQATQELIEEILNDKKYGDAIKVYNNKGLTKQVSSLFGFKPNEFVEFVQRLISSKDGAATISIMQKKLPQITP